MLKLKCAVQFPLGMRCRQYMQYSTSNRRANMHPVENGRGHATVEEDEPHQSTPL